MSYSPQKETLGLDEKEEIDKSSQDPRETEEPQAQEIQAPKKDEEGGAPLKQTWSSPPPDGGRGWFVVLGSFFALFVSFGWINCVGVFQTYYEATILKEYSASDIAWISSCEAFMMFAGGPIVGRLLDMYGVTYILPIGSFLHVFGLMMTSLSNNYYQIILSQGFCSPLGASMIFFSGIFATGGWFDKKRALAFGIVASGSSLGGVIFPIMLQRLIPEIGFPWAMRTAAFMILGLLLIANATIKTRFPPAPKPLQLKLYVTPFREAPFALTMLSGFFSFFGFLIPFNFVQESALYYGMSQGLAQYMIPILNAASIFGRVLAGFMGDKLGRFNIMSIVLGVSGLVCLAIWLPARSNAPIIVFAIIYGFVSGAIVSMAPSCIAQISNIRELGSRNGIYFAVVSVGALVGSPIGGQLISHDNGSFTDLQVFSGVMLLAGTVAMVAARFVQTRSLTSKV